MTPWELPPRMRNKVAVDADSGCWLWIGSRNSRGYGLTSTRGVLALTHRRSYELLVAPIPDGLTIDHLCLVKRCLNPEHLEPVPRAENIRRAADLIQQTPFYPCGHPRTEENTLVGGNRPSARRSRRCRTCLNAAARRNYRARKAAA